MNAKQRNKNRDTAAQLHYALQTPVERFGRVSLQRPKGPQKIAEAFERARPR